VPFANATDGRDHRPSKERWKGLSGTRAQSLGESMGTPAIGADGWLYISDDGSGSIYRVTWDGK
jgi:glucose/arabinose dehydrogenase